MLSLYCYPNRLAKQMCTVTLEPVHSASYKSATHLLPLYVKMFYRITSVGTQPTITFLVLLPTDTIRAFQRNGCVTRNIVKYQPSFAQTHHLRYIVIEQIHFLVNMKGKF